MTDESLSNASVTEESGILNAGTTDALDKDEVVEDTGFTRKQLRRNMTFCILLDAIYLIGVTDYNLALIPLLVFLKASNTTIGLVSGAGIATLLGNFLSPFITRRFRVKKWYFFGSAIPYLAAIGAGGVIILMSHRLGIPDAGLLNILVGCVLLYYLLAGFNSLPGQEFIAGCIPASHRGRYSGLSQSVGNAISFVALFIGTWILKRYGDCQPMVYGGLFVMMWFFCQTGFTLALFAKEKPVPIEMAPKAWSREMFRTLRQDTRFLRYIALMVLIVVGGSISAFVTVYGFRDLGMKPMHMGIIQMLQKSVSVPAFLLGGIAVDRLGPKRLVPYWPLWTAAMLLPPIFIHNVYGVYGYIFTNAAFGGLNTSLVAMLNASLPKPEHRAGHYTILILIQFSITAVAAMLSGRLMDCVGYRTGFVIGVFFLLAIFPVAKWVAAKLDRDIRAYG